MLIGKIRSFFNMTQNEDRLSLMVKPITKMPPPETVLIEPSYICNQKCLMCERHYKDITYTGTGFLEMRLFEKVLPILNKNTTVNLSGYGEAFLHPDYLYMLRQVSECGVRKIEAYSNCSTLKAKIAEGLVRYGMTNLTLSIHAATNETNMRIVNRNLDKVLDNLKTLQDIKKREGKDKPEIIMQIVLMKENIDELPAYVEIAGRLGVRYIAGVHMVVQDKSMIEQNILMHPERTKKAYDAAREIAKKMSITLNVPPLYEQADHKQEDKKECEIGGIFNYMNVRYNGKVEACDWMHEIGDLNESDIFDIWNGKVAQAKRQQIYEKGIASLCPGCPRWKKSTESFIRSEKFNEKSD